MEKIWMRFSDKQTQMKSLYLYTKMSCQTIKKTLFIQKFIPKEKLNYKLSYKLKGYWIKHNIQHNDDPTDVDVPLKKEKQTNNLWISCHRNLWGNWENL